MYFVLYDRFLRSIGETYILESWSRIQRAVDFDELKIEGELIPYSADPFLVVINDRQGKIMFSGLASTPSINDKTKKTTLSLKDYTTLFNTEIILDWSLFTGKSVGDYLDFALSAWLNQTDVGMEVIRWDVRKLLSIPLDTSIPIGTGKENVSLHSIVYDVLNYYNAHCDPVLDLFTKTLTFVFKESFKNTISIRLSDFGVTMIDKSFGEYNRVTVYSSLYEKNQEWALSEDNSVVKLPSEKPLVYPAKNRNFVAENGEEQSLYNAVYDAVMGLAGNRYQENIDLDAQRYKSIIDIGSVDFSYSVQVYTNDGYYKTLPVGEIETDSKGKHIIRLGYRIQELTQRL